MHLLIIGASGRTGKLVVDEALARGHTVTALVRDPSSLPARDRLTVVKGTPLSKSDIETAFSAAHTSPPAALIVALNPNRASDSPFAAVTAPPRLMADSNANAVAVMKSHNVRKIVTMSAIGVGDSFLQLNFFLRWLFRWSNMSYTFEDHDMVDVELKRSGLDYVLPRPCMLTDKEAAPVRFYGNVGKGTWLMSSISRRTVAKFLVDAVEQSTWDCSTPVISN